MTAPIGVSAINDERMEPAIDPTVDLTDLTTDRGAAPRQKVMAGVAMRRARELAGVDRSTAATEIGVGRWDLRAIESGRRGADVAVVQRAIDLYGGERLDLPQRVDLVSPADPYLLVIGDEQVQVDPFRDDDGEVLAAYVAAVRRQRGLEPAAVVRFRAVDLVQLASILDLSSGDLADRLRRLTGLDRDPAIQAARRLVLTGLAMAIVAASAPPAGRLRIPGVAGRRLFDVGRSRTAASTSDSAAGPLESFGVLGDGGIIHTDLLLTDLPLTDLPHTDLHYSDRLDDRRVDDDALPLFTVRERGAAVVADSSWLARDGSRPTFSTVPTVQLDAIADLVAQVEPVIDEGEPALPVFAAPFAALPPASAAGGSPSSMGE